MVTLLRWVARWPLRLLHAVGAALGWFTYALSPSYRTRVQAHARRAGLNPQAARRSVAQAGRMVAELPWLWLSPPERRWADWVEWRGVEVLEAALEEARGVMILTPHLGSFEVCALAYAERYGARAPMTALYRPARKAWLRELQETSRQRPGLMTAPANLSGVRQMIRALRRGQTIGLLPDQVPPQGMGVWAPFFGAPAYTMTLASRLAEQTSATLVLMWCERRPQGRGWVLHVLPAADAGPGALSPEGTNRMMEGLIMQAPEQYLWGYHRYKQPRQDVQGERP